MGAKPQGKQACREGFCIAVLSHGLAGYLAQKPLARQADQYGMARGGKPPNGAQQRDILLPPLGKAETGVQGDVFQPDPRGNGAVAHRTREIGTLRALGFSRRAIKPKNRSSA